MTFKSRLLTGLAGFFLLAGTASLAQEPNDPDNRGFEISARSDRTDRGYDNSRVELEMILRNAAGEESRRLMEISTLEVPDETIGDRSLIVFSAPLDIENTALLSHAQILEPDDQWLFLPALGRVRRIASDNKSGPFVGSEFAFEDFTAQELRKFDYEWLREEACGAFVCDVVVRYPLYDESGYTRQISWIDQTDFQLRRVDFYDRRDALLKTLELSEYREYGGGIWRPHLMTMTNHQTGKSTDLIFGDYEFGVGLDDNDFVRGVLNRLR